MRRGLTRGLACRVLRGGLGETGARGGVPSWLTTRLRGGLAGWLSCRIVGHGGLR
jgi:hypothetical protein